MRPRLAFRAAAVVLGTATLLVPALSHTQTSRSEAPLTSPEERALLHAGNDWQLIAPHLPNPADASAKDLEIAGDVLRARRFPEDSLDFYGYAMARGGDVSKLLNKMGIVRLELRQITLAQQMFQRAVSARKKDPQAWNNLGASEYAQQNYRGAVSSYRHAVKLQRTSAIFHSNLGMAYFELKDGESARHEFATALKLDPEILQHREGGSGSTAHILATSNYAGLCYEMARMYAHEGKVEPMLEWLAKASEGGFPVRDSMHEDAALRPWIKDTRVLLLLSNAEQLTAKTGRPKTLAAAALPSLGSSPDSPVPVIRQ